MVFVVRPEQIGLQGGCIGIIGVWGSERGPNCICIVGASVSLCSSCCIAGRALLRQVGGHIIFFFGRSGTMLAIADITKKQVVDFVLVSLLAPKEIQ